VSDPLIRPGTDSDGPGIGRVLEAVFRDYSGCLYEPSEFPELAAVASHYAARNGAIWVVEQDGRVAGCCAVFRTAAADAFELSKVYLLPTVRGRGLATRMIEMAAGLAGGRGARRLELFTDTRFHDAHRLYGRLGFVRLPGERCLGDTSDSWEFHYEREL
jgi:putative acetyltransferase